MTPAEVEALALRILEVIPSDDPLGARRHFHHAYKRVESDLAGWMRCQQVLDYSGAAWQLATELQKRFEDNLIRLAHEYGARQ